MEKWKLEKVEEHLFDLFRRQGTARLLVKEVFNSPDEFANADFVRAFEDLEKKKRLLMRYTKEGNDWVQLMPEGARRVGLTGNESVKRPDILPYPPRGST